MYDQCDECRRFEVPMASCRKLGAGASRTSEAGHGCSGRPRMVSRRVQWYWSRMTDVLIYALVPLALVAVAIVLLLGFLNFARGGSPQTSQKLMRWRVLMQFVALIVI